QNRGCLRGRLQPGKRVVSGRSRYLQSVTPKEIVVDERGRTSLARVRRRDFERYVAEEFPDGTLVLTPAVTVTALEMAALRDPKVRAAVKVAKGGDCTSLRARRTFR
ncbi:MAG TPA: hypothetical protein VNG13_15450, partial [Mycobacteriales bacterium]|nr:hypothetical protein [Mycobacteriales bacterium]